MFIRYLLEIVKMSSRICSSTYLPSMVFELTINRKCLFVLCQCLIKLLSPTKENKLNNNFRHIPRACLPGRGRNITYKVYTGTRLAEIESRYRIGIQRYLGRGGLRGNHWEGIRKIYRAFRLMWRNTPASWLCEPGT